MNILKRLNRYIGVNILAMLGMSLYILADTFFISLANGADGLTALNLVLPIYNIVYAIGAMIGVGSSIKFGLYIFTDKKRARAYFSNAIIWNTLFGIMITIIVSLFAKDIIILLGGEGDIIELGSNYIKYATLFAPFFMLNYAFVGFVRNDQDPNLAMVATLVSSLSNVVLDYILMFPLNLGMTGAALATGFSPIISILICLWHFKRPSNNLHFKLMVPSFSKLIEASKLGVSAFIGEMSIGITTLSFNYILLNLNGNMAVAAYGIITNVAIIATATFNGIGQGLQPLASEYYGIGDVKSCHILMKSALKMALFGSILIIIGIYFNREWIVAVFNSENSKELANIALNGIGIYFAGYLFGGINMVNCAYLSAIDNASMAFIISMLRGVILIVICAFCLSYLFGINGVWASFALSEFITLIISIILMKRQVLISK